MLLCHVYDLLPTNFPIYLQSTPESAGDNFTKAMKDRQMPQDLLFKSLTDSSVSPNMSSHKPDTQSMHGQGVGAVESLVSPRTYR